jgi:nicotinate-nucleotide adenylyltransferase
VSGARRIGVFGGTFDPIHNAHLGIARAALSHGRLDEVRFVIAGRPPHKMHDTCATPEERYAMVQAALADEPRMAASRLELDRTGPSYTFETLEAIAQDDSDVRLYLILGMDSLVDLPNWRAPERIIAAARFLVVPRPGSWNVPGELENHCDVLPFEPMPLSSTDVRERLRAGLPLDDLLPPSVERLIRERGIYGLGDADRAG